MKQLTVLLTILLVCIHFSYAQNASLKGTVIDTGEDKILTNSVIAILRRSDSVLTAFTRTNQQGRFAFEKLPAGNYYVMITHPQYADYIDYLDLEPSSAIDLKNVVMTLKSQLLEEVIVTRKLGAIRIKGDTVEYKADSFYVPAGSTVEDLLKKLPGIQVDKDGRITAQGETVQKVLVDGEEFFSDDPTIATRGLVAEAVDKVQVYDKKSDQAEFTGIDDGQRTKTIDLKLKEDRKNGYFGKVELGSDFNKYWNNNIMLNAFKGKRKFSAYGIMSNTGKTGLDFREKMNYGGMGGGMSMGVTDDGGMFISISSSDEFDAGGFWGEGLPKGWSGGFNYSNKWNDDKISLNGGYRYSKINSEAEGTTLSQYLLGDTILYVDEYGNSYSSKDRHKANGIYEWKIDSMASIKVTADGWTGNTENLSNFHSLSQNNFGDTLSRIDRSVTNTGDNKAFNSTVLWRQKFRKSGRTLSVSLGQNYTENETKGFLYSENLYYSNGLPDRYEDIDQQKINSSIGNTVNGRISYTEPLSQRSLLEFSYAIDNSDRKSNITTLEKTTPGGKYDQQVDSLSNDYSFNVFSNLGGIAYRYSKPKRWSFSAGMNVSRADYTRKDLQTDSVAKYSFTNFFPQAYINFNLGSNSNLRLSYNGNTRPPSIDQIQPIQDNTNQLNIRVGNPDLKQSFRHSFTLNFNSFKFLSERNFYGYASFSFTQNDFSSTNTIDATGRKVYMPVNVNGNYNGYAYMDYSRKIKKLNLRIGFGLDLNTNNNISFINGKRNENTSYSLGGGPTFHYNLDKAFNISLSPRITRNISESTLQSGVNPNFWSQNHEVNVYVALPWKIDLNTDVNFNLREKTDAFDQNNNVIKWNASLTKKLLKNNAGLLRLSVNDILDQNLGYSRNINSNFVTERTYNTFRRYFLLSLIYNFNKNGNPVQF